jgi:acetoin utilization protein AcuB
MEGVPVSELLTIKSYYIPLAHVLDVADPVWKAWRLMKDHKVRLLPVMKSDRIIGVISDRDILQISGFNGGQSMPVKDAMSLDPLVLGISTSLDEALRAMLEKEQQYAIVVNESKEACGLFTWQNALEFILDKMEPHLVKQSATR